MNEVYEVRLYKAIDELAERNLAVWDYMYENFNGIFYVEIMKADFNMVCND